MNHMAGTTVQRVTLVPAELEKLMKLLRITAPSRMGLTGKIVRASFLLTVIEPAPIRGKEWTDCCLLLDSRLREYCMDEKGSNFSLLARMVMQRFSRFRY